MLVNPRCESDPLLFAAHWMKNDANTARTTPTTLTSMHAILSILPHTSPRNSGPLYAKPSQIPPLLRQARWLLSKPANLSDAKPAHKGPIMP